jgi:hypothetical protein
LRSLQQGLVLRLGQRAGFGIALEGLELLDCSPCAGSKTAVCFALVMAEQGQRSLHFAPVLVA